MRKIFYKVLLIYLLISGIFAAAEATEPIKIAAIFAKTGIAGKDNAPEVQMAELSVEEINNQGGLLGRPVKLVILDNKGSTWCPGSNWSSLEFTFSTNSSYTSTS
jgi:branched-chain amino acid transport system substrate-binding protein